jgi:hypothetical protein
MVDPGSAIHPWQPLSSAKVSYLRQDQLDCSRLSVWRVTVLGQEPLDRRAQSGSHVLSETQSAVTSRGSEFTRSRVMSASAPVTHLDDRGLVVRDGVVEGQLVRRQGWRELLAAQESA